MPTSPESSRNARLAGLPSVSSTSNGGSDGSDLASEVQDLKKLREQLESELAQRKHAQSRLALQYSIAQVLAKGSTVADLVHVLRLVCETTDWDLGAIWVREQKTDTLRCAELWHQPGVTVPDFVRMTRDLRLELGRGFPGEVWAGGRPAWETDLSKRENLPRAAVAMCEGLTSAFGFPISIENHIVGVMEFFRQKKSAPDPDFVEMAQAISTQVGQFIERKSAETDLHAEQLRQRDSEEASRWLAAIVASSDDAIIGKNLSGIITSWNAGAQRIFGYTPEEIVGKSIFNLIPPELHHEEPSIIGRIQRGERIDHYETRRRRKDGRLIDVSITVSPIKDRIGKIIGASKIARDITAQKEGERALRETKDELARINAELEDRVRARTASLQQAIEQMEEFSYSVSHDLRSPARAMAGYAAAVIEDYGAQIGPEGRDFLDRIVRNASRMDRLIQDLLTYGRLSRREIAMQPVSLDRLVHEIIDQYAEMQPPRAEINVSGNLDTVIAHEPSLTQAISNLLSNAVKFVPAGTKPIVRLSSERRDNQVRLWVEDNGIGIPEQYRERLFGMFERVHPDKKYEGTGIGLAIVRKAAERMGGSAGVESDGKNGSKFWIQLPAAPASQ